MKMIGLTIVGLILTLVVSVFYFSKTNLSLVAQEPVSIYESVDSALAPPPQKIITKLQPQKSVDVIRCIDVKHYLIYEVRLHDGQVGFVNEGKYILLRNGKASAC